MTRRVVIGLTLLVLAASSVGVVVLRQSGALQLNRPAPELYPITGIDVSHHQGAIDWTAVAASGQRFAFIKATEGRDWVDSRFAENIQGARAANIPAGSYHFFMFCSPGAEQASHFLSVAPPTADSLPPVIDIEFVGNCKSWSDLAAVRAELVVFLQRVESAWGVRPILYVTTDALKRVIADAFADHPIWIRNVLSEPKANAQRAWLLWQFSDSSRIPGIEGLVDRNALRTGATLADLRVPSVPEPTKE